MSDLPIASDAMPELEAVSPIGEGPIEPPMPPAPSRPDHVPEKFWDAGAGCVRVEPLLKSYGELERRLGRSVALPEGELDAATADKLLAVLGRPASPDGYVIQPTHELIAPDAELNGQLHAAGFTQRQAELVYQLAAQRLAPVIEQATVELEAMKQRSRLEKRFGGAEAWQETARQIKTWSSSHLDPETSSVLGSSYEGVVALYQMMRTAEPELLDASTGEAAPTEAGLDDMVRDPRYWRDRDPEFVAKVTRAFRQLYAG